LSAIDEKQEAELERDNLQGARNEPGTLQDEQTSEAQQVSFAEVDGSHRWGNREVEVKSVRMLDSSGQERWVFSAEDEAIVEVEYSVNEPIEELVFGIGIQRSDGLTIHGTNTGIDSVEIPVPDAETSLPVTGSYRYTLKRLGLVDDSYYLDVAAHREDGVPYDYHHRLYKFRVRSSRDVHGVYAPSHEWEISTNYAV
jgi:hypothetical protein